MEERLQKELEAIRNRDEFRTIEPLESGQGRTIRVRGKEYLNFASNNYLGLAEDPRVKAAMVAGVERWGVGAGAARLVNGSMEIFNRLEEAIAKLKGFEAALLFSSGYHANVGGLASLLNFAEAVLSDELNHASMIDGIRLGQAHRQIYPHLDLNHVEAELKRHLGESDGKPKKLIATEAVFSMDGDMVDLPQLVTLAEKYYANVFLDEAHATGVFGKKGGGLSENLTPEQKKRVIAMGTLGKALGCFGAYIAGSKTVIEFLRQRARTFVFTTALPPAIGEAALKAVEICEQEPQRRENLWARIRQWNDAGRTKKAQSPIIPIHIGESQKAVEIHRALREQGIWVNAIRPPTVRMGTARLRVTLMATHTEEDVERLLKALPLE